MEHGSATGRNGRRPYIDGEVGVEDTLTANSYRLKLASIQWALTWSSQSLAAGGWRGTAWTAVDETKAAAWFMSYPWTGQGWAVRQWRRLREWGGERGFLETGSGVEKRGDSLAADMAGRSPDVRSRSRFRHVVCCGSGGVRMGWGNSELAMCLAS